MSDKTNARNQDRTPYRGPVWIQPAEGASLVGDVRNVSQGGMFVNVVPTPPIGLEIVCELPGYRAVRGRVVWISSPAELSEHGVGIEFVDLTERPTPILAMPTTTYAGIEFAGPLDFLREGSEVHIAAPSGHRQLRARVADVELDHAHGATILALSLVIAPGLGEHRGHSEDDDWFPDITLESGATVIATAAPRVATPIVEPPAVDRSTVETSSVEKSSVETSAMETSAVEKSAFEPPIATHIDLPVLAAPVLDAPAFEVPISVSAEAAVLEPESSDRRVEDLLARRDSQLDDTVALVSGAPDDTERTVLVSPIAAPPRRSNVLVPFLAVSAVILVGLAVVHGGFATSEQPAPLSVAPIPVVTESPVTPAAPAPMVAEPMVVPPAKPAVAPTVAGPIAAPKPTPVVAEPKVPVDPSMWKPEIASSKGEPSVLVPLEGSTKGMTHFELDQPQGIAVDLPNARLAIAAKPYLLHHASFTSLWVRKMDKGVQIRLHVTKGVHVEAVLEDGGLRIRRK